MAIYKHILTIPANFSFLINLNYLQATEDGLYRASPTSVSRFIQIEEDFYFVSIYSKNDTELVIVIEDTSNSYNQNTEKEIIAYVRDWFDLEMDVSPFYKMAKADRFLKKPVTQFYGLRNIAIPDLFEALVWAILGQQINLQYAYTLKNRFIRNFGKSMKHNGETYWLFPSAQVIASLDIDELLQLGMTRRKSEYIYHIAELMTDNYLSKEKLLMISNLDIAVKELTSIRGIGSWTANYVLMRCLRFRSAFPISDTVLHNAIKFAGSFKQKPSLNEIKCWASSWSGYEAYATFYLWRFYLSRI